MWLYRPCGLEEMVLVWRSGSRRWPPRLPEQPIFYPVTNQGYAARISRDWNTKSGTGLGYVTRFELEEDYASSFEPKVVGARQHEELWVPAEELETFNDHIEGLIEVIELYANPDAVGSIPTSGELAGKGAREQLVWFQEHLGGDELERVLLDAREHVWLNWSLWRHIASEDPRSQQVLDVVGASWSGLGMQVELPDVVARMVAAREG